MRPLKFALLEALRHLATFVGPEPMRNLARGLFIRPQRMANRVWQLRLRGLADKPGDEAYCITDAGKAYLEAARYSALVQVARLVPVRKLDGEDKSLEPSYEILFAGPEVADEANLRELALDEFHATVPINCLEDFEFSVHNIQPWNPNGSNRDKEAPGRPKKPT
jgi:hypothetical protein